MIALTVEERSQQCRDGGGSWSAIGQSTSFVCVYSAGSNPRLEAGAECVGRGGDWLDMFTGAGTPFHQECILPPA
ncbi:MAG: hypothetical protein NXI12_06425 [Alphaproteobacteria bacterium]|nr:hypothetical protein [Alphaproteobacteria bacterium]